MNEALDYPSGELCDYEIKFLKHLVTGVSDPDIYWGAAMSVALENLSSMGYLSNTDGLYETTEKAKKLFP